MAGSRLEKFGTIYKRYAFYTFYAFMLEPSIDLLSLHWFVETVGIVYTHHAFQSCFCDVQHAKYSEADDLHEFNCQE